MPALCGRYAAVSPWNIHELTVTDFFDLRDALKAEMRAAESTN